MFETFEKLYMTRELHVMTLKIIILNNYVYNIIMYIILTE